jgi:hypothetical protein
MAEDQFRLVAAHDWDVTGALHAGLKAGFVARPGKVLNPLGEQPDIVGRDLREIAPCIIERDLPAERHGVTTTESGTAPMQSAIDKQKPVRQRQPLTLKALKQRGPCPT